VTGAVLSSEMNVEKLILLVKEHQAIYDASDSDHGNRNYIASLWAKMVQEMDLGKWTALVFFARFEDDNDDVHNKKNSNTISDKVFIRPYISSSCTLFLA
jgi:hypothetical protein